MSHGCKINDFEPFLLLQFFVLSDVRNIVHEDQDFFGFLALVLELLQLDCNCLVRVVYFEERLLIEIVKISAAFQLVLNELSQVG